MTPATLARVAPTVRPHTPLGAVALPVTATVEADRPLADVVALAAGGGAVPVVDHGILIGTLTIADVARAVDLDAPGGLARPRHRSPRDPLRPGEEQ